MKHWTIFLITSFNRYAFLSLISTFHLYYLLLLRLGVVVLVISGQFKSSLSFYLWSCLCNKFFINYNYWLCHNQSMVDFRRRYFRHQRSINNKLSTSNKFWSGSRQITGQIFEYLLSSVWRKNACAATAQLSFVFQWHRDIQAYSNRYLATSSL